MDFVSLLKKIHLNSNLHKNYKTRLLDDMLAKNKHLPPQGSDEWLGMRTYNIGGSEMATITGDSAFSNIPKLVAQKIGMCQFKGNTATRWGNMFEPITQMIMEKLFDIDSIQETGSLEGAVAHQRYSPDGLAIVKMVCSDTIGGEYVETQEYCVILFEFKSPFSSIPSGYIPKYYIPQVKTGLCSIPITDFALFVSNMFRKCSFADLRNNPTYDTCFHDKDAKKKFVSSDPLAMGLIILYQTNEQRVQLGKKYIYQTTYGKNDIYDSDDDSDDSDDVPDSGDDSDSGSDSDSDGASAVFKNIGNVKKVIKPIYNSIYESYNTQHSMDFGKSYYGDFSVILELYSEKLISAKYCSIHVFDKYYDHPFLRAQNKSNGDNTSVDARMDEYKREISKLNVVGYIPWKLFVSDIICQEREDGYVNKYNEPIQEVIQVIKDINTYNTKKEKIEAFKKYYPKSNVLKSAGVDNEHFSEFVPRNM